MMKRTLIATGVVLSLAAPALAQTAAPTGTTLSQFQAERADKMFARLDANKDGKLAADELRRPGHEKGKQVAAAGDAKAGPPMAGAPREDGKPHKKGKHGPLDRRAFAEADKDKDSALTRNEVNAMLAERFKRKDTNNDGVLSPEELKARPDRAKVGV